MEAHESNKKQLFNYLEKVFTDLEQQKIALDESAIVAITDIQGNIKYVNHKFCEISQYNREELMGQNHRIINSGYHPPEFFSDLWRTISAGKIWRGEIKNKAKNGTYYWVYTTIIPYINESGKPYQYAAIRFDITKQKTLEFDLKERSRQLEDFCFIVSHNLRAPLTNLLLLTSMIEDTEEYEEQKILVKRLSKPVHFLNETFNDLVESLQVRKDGLIERDHLILEECLQTTLDSLCIDYEAQNIEIKSDFKEVPQMEYPKKYIMSYFHNLISNSIRYREPQGKLKVMLETYKDNDSIILKVTDNGLGIDMKVNGDKIFGLRKTFHGNKDAKGFGLFITKTQVEAMGGDIYVESAIGKGATFYIRFNKTKL